MMDAVRPCIEADDAQKERGSDEDAKRLDGMCAAGGRSNVDQRVHEEGPRGHRVLRELTMKSIKKANRASEAQAEDDWHVLARLGLWATSLDGTSVASGRESEIDAGLGDLFDKSNFTFAPGFEVGKGNWASVLSTIFSQLESESVFPVLNRTGKTKLDTYIADLAFGYRVVDVQMGEKEEVPRTHWTQPRLSRAPLRLPEQRLRARSDDARSVDRHELLSQLKAVRVPFPAADVDKS
jgi:hypothetical protein